MGVYLNCRDSERGRTEDEKSQSMSGLRFDIRSGELYIADAYLALLKVGSEGGLAMPLVTEAKGLPLRFTNDLDIDDDGNVYFTDSSSVCQRSNYMQLVFSGESSGRVLKYDLVTKQTIVLLKDVLFPNGLSLCKDQKFFVICQASGRLKRYWLKREKAGRDIMIEELASKLGLSTSVPVHAVLHDWIRHTDGKLSFLGFVKLLHGVSPRSLAKAAP